MYLSDNDLRQLDGVRLEGLLSKVLHTLSMRFLSDLKEVRERLNQTPEFMGYLSKRTMSPNKDKDRR